MPLGVHKLSEGTSSAPLCARSPIKAGDCCPALDWQHRRWAFVGPLGFDGRPHRLKTPVVLSLRSSRTARHDMWHHDGRLHSWMMLWGMWLAQLQGAHGMGCPLQRWCGGRIGPRPAEWHGFRCDLGPDLRTLTVASIRGAVSVFLCRRWFALRQLTCRRSLYYYFLIISLFVPRFSGLIR